MTGSDREVRFNLETKQRVCPRIDSRQGRSAPRGGKPSDLEAGLSLMC